MTIDFDKIQRLTDRLMDHALASREVTAMFHEMCCTLRQAGIPVDRGHISHRLLHPQYRNEAVEWTLETGPVIARYSHATENNPVFLKSTVYHVLQNKLETFRLDLAAGEGIEEFPLMKELRDEGYTDYYCILSDWGAQHEQGGMMTSYATKDPAGFSEEALAQIHRVNQRLSVAIKVTTREQMAVNIANTYLGHAAGKRVIEGSIRQGDGEHIDAVIVYIDLRGSTAMADSLPAEVFMQNLHAFFEAKAAPILDEGGEILAYIGDAIMGIFPYCTQDIGRTKREACQAAVRAMVEADKRLAELNENRTAIGLEPLRSGTAFHVGSLLYGNVGVAQRLQFTVIGRTANEVARLEGLTKELSMSVLASAEFAHEVALPWCHLGPMTLRGVNRPIDVYGLPDKWEDIDTDRCLKAPRPDLAAAPAPSPGLAPELSPELIPAPHNA
ncbi:MAG: adenylate/guanylate cyclase domain-containing protein [Alphaproteobacteria bacterium]|nr:adenylate/guanylate cyclase domain-containing protein [Alphaproteobacteria bacterium]